MSHSAFVYLTEASSGATRNSGTNGDLNALAWWALQQVGCTRLNNAGTNETVFQFPYNWGGTARCLYICHDSSKSGAAQRAVWRGCESASAYNTRVDEFPQAGQVADASCNALVSTTASTASMPFIILAWADAVLGCGFIYISLASNTTDTYDAAWFVDCPSRIAGDVWGTVCGVRASANNTIGNGISVPSTPFIGASTAGTGLMFAMRNATGTVKSSRLCVAGGGNTTGGQQMGLIAGAPAIASGLGAVVERARMLVHCLDSSTTTPSASAVLERLRIPFCWQPKHSSLVGRGAADTYDDAAYNASAHLQLIKIGVTSASCGFMIEKTDTDDGHPGA